MAKSSTRERSGLGLRARGTVAFALGALILSAVLAVLTYQITRTYLLDQRESLALRQASVHARAVSDVLRAADPDVPALLSGISTGTDAEPVLQLGDAFFATAVASGDEGVPLSLVRTTAGGDAARQRVSSGGQPRLVIGIPLADSDAVYYEVFSLGELEHTLSTLRWSLLAAASFTTVLGALVGAYASRQVLRPLRGFATGAAQIAEGHLDTRLQAPGDADLAPLATSFNDMAETLQHRVERETRFASDVTHELRTRQAVDVLRNQVRHFERLVLDLLEISRFDLGAAELTLETVAPAEFTGSVLRSLDRADVPLRVESSAPALFALDKVRVERILANLLDNADRYAGGATAIELSGHDECLQIAVEDAGPGLAEEERTAVFERFHRSRAVANDSHRGTGLGLALVAEHAALHRGRAWVEERDGGGARFVVDLGSTEQ
jgi:two-component system sensor histidine kinase MtrB